MSYEFQFATLNYGDQPIIFGGLFTSANERYHAVAQEACDAGWLRPGSYIMVQSKEGYGETIAYVSFTVHDDKTVTMGTKGSHGVDVSTWPPRSA